MTTREGNLNSPTPMNNDLNWPSLPKEVPTESHPFELLKARYQKELDLHAAVLQKQFEDDITRAVRERTVEDAQEADDIERRKQAYSNYYTVFQAVLNAYLEVGKTTVATIQARAQFIVTAAGAIVTLYTGLLGFVFTIDKDNNHPLPERGIWAGIFLGLSIVLAAVYYAYITKKPVIGRNEPEPSLRTDAIDRVYDFVGWVHDKTLERRYFLQAGLVSLGLGVAFLPAAFTDLSDSTARVLGVVGLLAVFIIPAIVKRFETERQS